MSVFFIPCQAHPYHSLIDFTLLQVGIAIGHYPDGLAAAGACNPFQIFAGRDEATHRKRLTPPTDGSSSNPSFTIAQAAHSPVDRPLVVVAKHTLAEEF